MVVATSDMHTLIEKIGRVLVKPNIFEAGNSGTAGRHNPSGVVVVVSSLLFLMESFGRKLHPNFSGRVT